MWCIQGTVTISSVLNGKSTTQIPTFYLDGNVQGIVDAEHALRIANEVVYPIRFPGLTVNLTAVKV